MQRGSLQACASWRNRRGPAAEDQCHGGWQAVRKCPRQRLWWRRGGAVQPRSLVCALCHGWLGSTDGMCVCPPARTAPCAAVGFVSPKPRINNRLSKVHCHDPHIPHPPASLQTMCAECLATWVTSNQTCPIDQKPLAANKVGGFLLRGGGVEVNPLNPASAVAPCPMSPRADCGALGD